MSNQLNSNSTELLSRITPEKASKAAEIINNDPDISRLLIEGLLWFAIVSRIFINQLGILNTSGLSGAIIISAGALCLLVMMINGNPVPTSVWFAFGVTVIGNITDLVITGLFSRDITYWMCLLLLACYVFRNVNAALRLSFFMAGCIFLTIIIGGTYYSVSKEFNRLGLEPGTVGTMFGNPNDLAQISCLTLSAILFLSIGRNFFIKFSAIIVCSCLSAIVLLTLSRQGLLMLLIILFFYLIMNFKNNINLFSVTFIFFIIIFISIIMNDKILEIYDGYMFRWTLDSARTSYWQSSLKDISETIISGRGTFFGYNSDGILPHSSFLWIHIAYGGICALIYTSWIVWLSIRVFKLFINEKNKLEEKLAAFSILIVFILSQFTSYFSSSNYGFIIGVALIERLISGGNLYYCKEKNNKYFNIISNYCDIKTKKYRLLQKC